MGATSMFSINILLVSIDEHVLIFLNLKFKVIFLKKTEMIMILGEEHYSPPCSMCRGLALEEQGSTLAAAGTGAPALAVGL